MAKAYNSLTTGAASPEACGRLKPVSVIHRIWIFVLILRSCTSSDKNQNLITQRAERIRAAIAQLQAKKSEIEAEGELAPQGCYVARYQARGSQHRYWYYQLKATSAIFPKINKDREYSRFQPERKGRESSTYRWGFSRR